MRRHRISRPLSEPARKCDRAIRDAILELKGAAPPPGPAAVASVWYDAIEGRGLSYTGLLVILTSAVESGRSEEAAQRIAVALSRWISDQYPQRDRACPRLALVIESKLDAAADVSQAIALDEPSPSTYLDAADETERLGHHALFTARVLRQAAAAQTPAVRSA